jgi:hypothetical protein
LLTSFIVVIDLMHAPHRGKGNWMIASNRWNPALGDLTLVEAFKRIDRSHTVEEFYEQIGMEKFYKYNFIANSKYGTIEFRQAEAYGDGVKAVAWVASSSFLHLWCSMQNLTTSLAIHFGVCIGCSDGGEVGVDRVGGVGGSGGNPRGVVEA